MYTNHRKFTILFRIHLAKTIFSMIHTTISLEDQNKHFVRFTFFRPIFTFYLLLF